MEPKPQKLTRPLHDWEVAEAQKVFGSNLAYERVRVHEGTAWPDTANVIGRWLRGLPAPGPKDHNAVTLFYGCYFPVNLPTTLPGINTPTEYFVDWLIHELAHCWQYQHTGAIYIPKAMWAQFTLGSDAYKFGGPENLIKVRADGGNIFSFDPEAQAVIAQTYYYWKRHGRDVSAFEPYLDDIRKAA
jgi:hypothetical protein